jgi:excisionase family DNA binding protein
MSVFQNTVLSRDDLQRLLKDQLFTLKEACYVTGFSRTTIWKLIKSRRLRTAENCGRAVRIWACDLMDCFRPKDKD